MQNAKGIKRVAGLLLLAGVVGYGVHFNYKYLKYVERPSVYRVYMMKCEEAILNEGNQKIVEKLRNNPYIEYLIEVKPENYSLGPIAKLPVNFKDKEIDQYIEPTDLVNFHESRIKVVAEQIIEGEPDAFVQTQLIAEWISKNIKKAPPSISVRMYNPVVASTARGILEVKQGSSIDSATLFAAMTRSLGIPTKYVLGHIFSEKDSLYYGWNEVYFPEYGWVSVDPVENKIGVTSRYIKLAEGIDYNALRIKGEDIKIGVIKENW